MVPVRGEPVEPQRATGLATVLLTPARRFFGRVGGRNYVVPPITRFTAEGYATYWGMTEYPEKNQRDSDLLAGEEFG